MADKPALDAILPYDFSLSAVPETSRKAEALGFDYVEPHTWNDQPEGYWRWQFSWGGPSDELRGYVNEHKELHRLEYWFLDWFDGASLLVSPGSREWGQMQEMIPH